MKRIYIIIAAVLLIAAGAFFIIYKYGSYKPQPARVNVGPTEVKINAKRLWVDYSMNKDIADPKYTGKVIEVTGTIMRVEVIGNKTIVVFAFKKGDNGDEGIRITMLPEFAQASKGINPFKNVTIKGLCKGYNGQDINMEDGSIIAY
jgi:hypothetical protein